MPESWKTYKLGDLTELTMGQSPEGSTTNRIGQGVPLLNGPTEFGYTNPVPVQFTSDPKRISDRGDLLFCVRGSTTGKMNFADQPYAIGRGIGAFRGKNGFPTKYVKYIIDLSLEKMLSISTGSTFPNLSRSDLLNFEISSSDPKDASAIASILSALDDKIELNLQMNKTLEEMAMALYKHWFIDFGPFQNGKFVESELGMIPEGWEVKRLEEVCNLTIGRTPPRKEPKWFSQTEGVKWISIKDIGTSGLYISQTSEYLSEEAVKKFNIPIIKANTVILSFKLTVGRVAISSERMLSNEAIAHLNRKDENIPVEFLYSYLRLFDYNSLGSTSSIATAVNTQTLKAMKITLPTNKLLSDYFTIVTDIFQQIKNNQEENRSLTTLRDTLLPKLISGSIRVKDVEQMAHASL